MPALISMHWSCQTWRFQYDYVELEHYANGIIKLVDPNSKFLTSLSDENNFQKTKIKSLEEEIKTFKIKILIWEKTSCPYLKWVKLSKVTTKQKQQTLPTNTRPRKTMTSNSNWQTKDREDQSIFTLKPATNSLHS